MGIGNRIAKINEKVAVNTYAINQYRENLQNAVNRFLSVLDEMGESSKRTIDIVDSRFIDKSFIESINKMDYDTLQSTQQSLELLLETIVSEIESNLK